MLPPLSVIREKRRLLGWTQKELANRSGVSQSTIAKIERGEMIPSYEIAQKIFTALEEGARNEKRKMARDIMTTRVIFVESNDTIGKTRQLMKEYAISQIPVLEDSLVAGMITEADVLEAYEKHGENANEVFVSDFMSSPPPQVPEDADIHVIMGILKQYPAVLVTKNGKIRGIITRADLVYWF